MQTVNSSYLKSLIKHAKNSHVDTSDLEYVMDEGRVVMEVQQQFWRQLVEKSGPLLGFEFGKQLQPADLGILGHILMTAADLGQALSFLQDFYPLVGEGGVIKIKRHQKTCSIIYVPQFDVAKEVRVEAVIACLINIGNKLTDSKIQIERVDIDFEPQKTVTAALANFAGCGIYTKQPLSRVILSAACLNEPLYYANADIVNSLLPKITEQLSQLYSISPLKSAQHFIELSPGVSRAQLAHAMHMSVRSLSRHLGQRGATFAKLQRDARQRQAKLFIMEQLSVERIAELLGYSDASAFIKAFRSWTGLTPKEYWRKEMAQQQ